MFKNLKISTRLVLVFSTIGIGIIGIVNYIGYSTAKRLMEEESYNKLIAVREIKKTQIREFFEDKIRDINTLAQGSDVHGLLEKLEQYEVDTLEGKYNAYDVSMPEYKKFSDEYGYILDEYIRMHGYHDIYIFDADHGHLMYTAAKGRDMGTNFNEGLYRDSHLAKLWRNVIKTKQVAVEDFQPYAPNNDDPTAFIGNPILTKTGKLIGVIALQISVDEINKIMQQRQGLGKTGETYLVGSDNLMRSDSFLDPQNYSVIASFKNNRRVNTEASRDALAENTDARIIIDYRGNPVLSTYTFVEFLGIRWALLAEIDEAEAFEDVYALRNTAFLWGVILIGVVIVGAIVFSSSITRPLKVAVAVADQVSEGNLNVEFDVASEDEIGQVLMSMKKMISYIQNIANVAEKISNKDLQVEVTPKSSQDILNHSLQRMVINLQAMMAETTRTMTEIEQQNWLKDGLNQLNNELLGESSLEEVCQKAASFVARYVNAGRGVLYIYDDEKKVLNLSGTFAFTDEDEKSGVYRLGEGIIGQVAIDRAPILLKDIKREESLITTGTVNEMPLNTYTFPLIYNNDLYGVFELASFETLDLQKQQFLNDANQVIATVLSSAAQRERVQELLRASRQAAKDAERAAEEAMRAQAEAQQKTEEVQRANVRLEEQQQQLQQQSEELQQLNAHLEEQQQQMEQQREELRQQQESLTRAQEELEQRKRKFEAV